MERTGYRVSLDIGDTEHWGSLNVGVTGYRVLGALYIESH